MRTMWWSLPVCIMLGWFWSAARPMPDESETVDTSTVPMAGLQSGRTPERTAATQPASHLNPQLDQWTQRLNDPDPDVRERAMFELVDLGEGAIPILARLMDQPMTPEVESRCLYVAQALFNDVGPHSQMVSFLGLQLLDRPERLSPATAAPAVGPVVSLVIPHLAADRGGLLPGDTILELAGNPAQSQSSIFWIRNILNRFNPGDPVTMTVLRNGRVITLQMTCIRSPAIHPLVRRFSGMGSAHDQVAYQFVSWFQARIDNSIDANWLLDQTRQIDDAMPIEAIENP